MRQIIWIAHTSLDGYVANRNGKLDDFESGEDNLAFVTDICKEADTILSGRVTHELLHSFWPDAGHQPGATHAEIGYSGWYNKTVKIVATRSKPQSDEDGISFIHKNLPQFVKQVRGRRGSPIVIFGSPNVAGQLMAYELIDVCWIFVNPVIFGGGIALFNNTTSQRKLKLTETRRFANGETALKYIVEK